MLSSNSIVKGFLFLCIGSVFGFHLVLMAMGLLPLPCVIWGLAIQILYTRAADSSVIRNDSLLLMATCGMLLIFHHFVALYFLFDFSGALYVHKWLWVTYMMEPPDVAPLPSIVLPFICVWMMPFLLLLSYRPDSAHKSSPSAGYLRGSSRSPKQKSCSSGCYDMGRRKHSFADLTAQFMANC